MAYKGNIKNITLKNNYFRKVIFTSKQQQLVVMSLKPHQEIGSEKHKNTSQFIRVEQGSGLAVIGDATYRLNDDSVVLIPSGIKHNIIAGKFGMKLYTIYSPPEHPKDTIEKQQDVNIH